MAVVKRGGSPDLSYSPCKAYRATAYAAIFVVLNARMLFFFFNICSSILAHIIRTPLIVHYSHVESILRITPISVPFSSAAATRSLSPSCLFTASSVLWVPFLIRTSTRNRGGKACSRRTRTPRPMTVASEQCVIVGVISTRTVLIGERGDEGGRM